jgi:hypothetical protein
MGKYYCITLLGLTVSIDKLLLLLIDILLLLLIDILLLLLIDILLLLSIAITCYDVAVESDLFKA